MMPGQRMSNVIQGGHSITLNNVQGTNASNRLRELKALARASSESPIKTDINSGIIETDFQCTTLSSK